MGRFSHMTGPRNPANVRQTTRFALALIFVLIFGVFYRGRKLSIHMEHFKADNVFNDDHSQNHVESVEHRAENATTQIGNSQIDNNHSAIVNDQPERQETAENDRPTDLESDSQVIEDPCIGRPQPMPIPENITKPPSLYFLHIPKTAGTLIHYLGIHYANKTSGLACQYRYDGNRFRPEDYHLSVHPPPRYPNGTLERGAVDAITHKNATKKLELLRNGACRTMRGHVTYKQRDYMNQPVVSLTVLRDPLERLLSMYEFAMMMVRARPGTTGWDHLISGNFTADFQNSSSLLHQGFYDAEGHWKAVGNIGFSFHFYGVLHQLSGINPVFEGVGIPEQFRISNVDELVEKAKDNICSTHILGTQSNMTATLDLFFNTIGKYSNWTDQEIKRFKSASVNKNAQKKQMEGINWPDAMQAVLQKRFQHETAVYNFTLDVIAYREKLANNNESGPPLS